MGSVAANSTSLADSSELKKSCAHSDHSGLEREMRKMEARLTVMLTGEERTARERDSCCEE